MEKLKDLVLEILKDEQIKVFIFGSRARKDNSIFSDVDIGLMPYGKIDETKITILRDEIEKLNIPYKVEVVNFLETSEDFKKEALREVVIWKD